MATARAASLIAADKSWVQRANADCVGVNITGSLTILALCKMPVLTPGLLCGKYAATGNQRQYGLYYGVSTLNRWHLNVSFNGTAFSSVVANSAGLPTAGAWYLVAGRRNQATGKLAITVNGVTDEADVGTGDLFTGNAPFAVGAQDGTAFFGAQQNCVRVWNRYLSDSELARQSNLVSGVPRLRPFSQLRASEKVGLVLSADEPPSTINASNLWTDLSGNGNHLAPQYGAIIDATTNNGAMETWTNSTTPGTWSKYTAGAGAVEQEASIVYAGSSSAKLSKPGAGDSVVIYQSLPTANKAYRATNYMRAGSGTPAMRVGDDGAGGQLISHTLSTSFAQYVSPYRCGSVPKIAIYPVTAGMVGYADNVVVQADEILTTTGPETTPTNTAGAKLRLGLGPYLGL